MMSTMWLVLVVSVLPANMATSQPCRRLLMQGADNTDVFPYTQLSGLYSITDHVTGGFPTYRHAVHLNEYFRYNNSLSAVVIGNNLLLGHIRGHLPRHDVTYPYGTLITGWQVYQPATHQYRWVSADSIRPQCVDDDPAFQLCDSGLLAFNDHIHLTNRRLKVTRYKQVYGEYSDSYRPVYQAVSTSQTTTKVYLYHVDNTWTLGYDYRTSSQTFAKVRDTALRPELITGTWQLYDNGVWRNNANLRLRCVGIRGATSCGGVQCQNGGTCISAGPQNIQCSCPPKYRGPRCQSRVPACPHFGNWTTSYGGWYYTLNSFEGSLATWFCPRGSRPAYGYSVCLRLSGRYRWSSHANCRPATTTTSTRQPWWRANARYKRSITSSERPDLFEHVNAWLIPVVVTFAILTQILAPFILYCILVRCCGYSTKPKKAKADEEENEALATRYRGRLDELESRTPKPDDTVKINELRGIEQQLKVDIARLKEERRERDLHQQPRKTVKLWRIVSLYCYISFWIWMVYMIVAAAIKIVQYSILFAALGIVAMVLLIILAFVLLAEHGCSSEKDYIRNLGRLTSATERIESIRNTQPTISMTAECYHYETRTRIVYYTDANGYQQSRIETYQEKVVTDIVIQPYRFTHWYDSSQSTLTDIRRVGITKIKMQLTVECGDEQTAGDFIRTYDQFREDNRYRDVFVDFSVSRTVDRFEKRLAAYTDRNKKPWWIGSVWFWVATLTCLGWPYRIAFNRATGKTNYSVVKVIYMNSASNQVDRTDGRRVRAVTSAGNSEESLIRDIKNRILTTINQLAAGRSAEDDNLAVRSASSDQHMNVVLMEAKHTPQPAMMARV